MVDYFRSFFYILIVIATVILTGAAQTPTKPECQYIPKGKPFGEWKDCKLDERAGFGSITEYVVLDFSLADPVDIKGFFDQATNPTYLKAGIKIVGNEKIETLNLENIKDWSATKTPTNVLFIDISHNLNLKEIKWDAGIFEPSPGNLVQILIYNNPKLTLSSSLEIKLLEKASNVTSYIQHNPTDCMFQHPNGGNFYHIPSQEMLDYCGTIKGDLILENVKLTKELKIIEPGCLALANVNMEEGKVDIGDFKNAKKKCKNGNDSKITNNPGLCGDKLSKLMEYFPAGSKPEVRLDTASCTQDECGESDAQHKYKMCKKITESVDITSWFENGAVDKKSQLESAAGFTLTIANSSTIKLSMPNLTAAEGLEIMDNKKLKELDLSQLKSLKTLKLTGNQIEELHLPNLVKLNTLKLTGNPKLKLDKLQQLNVTVADMKQSKVECYTDMDSNGAFTVTNISQIRLCTHIIGKLIIRGLQKNVDPATVHLREIKGCLEIRDTKLTEVKFLDNVNFDVNGCIGGRHLLTDNPDLCPPNYEMKKVTFVATGGKTFGCGKLCRKLEKGCTVLNGSLTIDSKTTEKELSYLAELGIVYGSVKIDGTTRTALEFPKLTEIHSATAPALQISNNEKLQAVKMEKLKTITVADGKKPKIKIIKNPQLTNQKTFVPGYMKCEENEKSDCYLVESKDEEDGLSSTILAIIAVSSVVGLALLIIGIVLICCFVIVIPADARKIKKNREEDRKRLRSRESDVKKFYGKGGKHGHFAQQPDVIDRRELRILLRKFAHKWREEEKKKKAAAEAAAAHAEFVNAGKTIYASSSSAPRTDPDWWNTRTALLPVDEGTKTAIVSVNEDPKTAVHDSMATAYIPPETEAESDDSVRSPPTLTVDPKNTFLKDVRFEQLIDNEVKYDEAVTERIICGIASYEPNPTRKYLYHRTYEGQNCFDARDFNLDPCIILSWEKSAAGYEATRIGNLLQALSNSVENSKRTNIIHVGRMAFHKFNGFQIESSNQLKAFNKPTCCEFVSYQTHEGIISDGGKTLERCVYVVNIQVEDTPGDNYTKYAEIPWLDILNVAKKNNVIIHTTSAKFYLFLQFILATVELLTNTKHYANIPYIEEFGTGIYRRFMQLYNPDVQPIDSYTLWVMHMLWNAKQLFGKRAVTQIAFAHKLVGVGRRILPSAWRKKIAEIEEEARQPVYEVEMYEGKIIEDNLYIKICLQKKLPNGEVDEQAPLQRQAIIKWNEGQKTPGLGAQWQEKYRVKTPGPGDKFTWN